MRTIKYTFFFPLLLIAACCADKYAGRHSPFPEDSRIEHLHPSQFHPAETIKDGEGKIVKQVFHVPENSATKITTTYTNGTCQASVEKDSRLLLDPTPFSSFDFGLKVGIYAFTAELNGDGEPDFLLHSYSGGCGPCACCCDVALILSVDGKYTLTSVSTFLNENNLISFDGRIYLVHTDVYPVEECLDGNYHLFRIYNLLEINDGRITLANSAYPGFPRISDDLTESRLKETVLLSDEDKQKIQKRVAESIFSPVLPELLEIL